MRASSTTSRKRVSSANYLERQGSNQGISRQDHDDSDSTIDRKRRAKWTSTRLFCSRNIVFSTIASLAILVLLIWLQRSAHRSADKEGFGRQSVRDPLQANEQGVGPFVEWPAGKLPRNPQRGPDERFLAYFPHSGFHNQRVALENALTLARLLNRTLLVPPVWLGLSVPFIRFDKMYDRLLMAMKVGLEHCRDAPRHLSIPQECLGGYWDYTTVSWDSLIDLGSITADQPLRDRSSMSYPWLSEELNIDLERDVQYFKDENLYDFRIFDNSSDVSSMEKFRQRLDIDALRAMQHIKLLHFGSLFATKRLRLTLPESKAIRNQARRSMVLSNPRLIAISNAIRDKLGGSESYFAVHIRLGDGVFRDNASNNAELILRQLLSRVGLLASPAGVAGEKSVSARSAEQNKSVVVGQWRIGRINTRSYETHDPHTHQPPIQIISAARNLPIHRSLKCPGKLHQDTMLWRLNTPLYIATDSRRPLAEPAMRDIVDLFPCWFTLSDFVVAHDAELQNVFADLDNAVNPADGVSMKSFLMPFIDAMVAASARDVVGTPGSTFSSYTVDVLHRMYHGWEIKERGK